MAKPVQSSKPFPQNPIEERPLPALPPPQPDNPPPPMHSSSRAQSPSTVDRSKRSTMSLAESVEGSYHTDATSTLPALQSTEGDGDDAPQPLLEEDLDPGSFDLVAPSDNNNNGGYALEKRCDLLFSEKHMAEIFADSSLLHRFTQFLCASRPASVPLLTYYLEAEKALRALQYANSVAASLGPLAGHEFSTHQADAAVNASLRAKRDAAFAALATEELPMYITHVWIQIVSLSIKRRIAGTMPVHLRQMSEGLAEVFCLTDPSRHDNPIIMASEEFHRTTQYGMNHVLGRNCRFLQGPGTSPFSVRRIREKLEAGKEHFETFLNYRRDGSPFLNLLLCAPLLDSRGKVRYFLGAQVDVSGLAKECAGLEGLKRLVASEKDEADGSQKSEPDEDTETRKTPEAKPAGESFQELCKILDPGEMESVRRYGGVMHRARDRHFGAYEDGHANGNWHKSHVVIQDGSPVQTPIEPVQEQHHSTQNGSSEAQAPDNSGRLSGVYENYLLVRPTSELRILFASPSLRVPGMLQSPLLSRIGGSGRTREQLGNALAEGHSITAKVRWISGTRRKAAGEEPSRSRWIHCTPLIGMNGAIGVWMIVVVDEESADEYAPESAAGLTQQAKSQYSKRKPKMAPPVDAVIGSQFRRAPSFDLDGKQSVAAGWETPSGGQTLDEALGMLSPDKGGHVARPIAV